MEYLSNIELYYALPDNCSSSELLIEGEESKHIVKVMRHSMLDELYVTNGLGKIFHGEIKNISVEGVGVKINKTFRYKDELSNITFCIPKLKSPERLEFALEKCTELGVTKFIIFNSERTISKSLKIERWNKIVLAAMKQSLRSYLPVIGAVNSFKELLSIEGEKFIFEQSAINQFNWINKNPNLNYYFIFGPEGGLSPVELDLTTKQNLYKLTGNRLRTETAIVKCASML